MAATLPPATLSATAQPTNNPTPPQEPQPSHAYATYIPHDLSYSADFEDSLISAVLDPPSPSSSNQRSYLTKPGLRVLPASSPESPIPGVSLRATDLSLQSLPSIPSNELPLPLSDSRRIFASPVPAVKLTHPGGYLEGGPGLDPEMDTFADDYLATHSIAGGGSAADLRSMLDQEIEAAIGVLRERLRKRRAARERNEVVSKELKVLIEQHGMELRVQKRLAEEGERKKEARERRRREREGG